METPHLGLSVPWSFAFRLMFGSGSLYLFLSAAVRTDPGVQQSVIRSYFIAALFFSEEWYCFYTTAFAWSLKQCQVWAPFHGVGLKSSQMCVGDSHKCCATTALAYLASRTPLESKGFGAGLVFPFLLWQHSEYLSEPKMLVCRALSSVCEEQTIQSW